MDLNRPLITAAAFMSLALNGMTFAFVGTSLPALREFMSINVELAGNLMATFQAGFTLFTLTGGLMSDLMRRERVLLLGSLLMTGGTLLLGHWTAFSINLILFFSLGMGAGLVLSGSNALLVGLYPAHKGLILNVHHVFFGLGSLIGPLLMGWLLPLGIWTLGYRGLGAASVLLAVIFCLVNTSRVIIAKKRDFGSQVGGLLTSPLYLVLAGVSALAVGVQLALTLLAVLFLTEAKALSIGAASLALSIFFVLLVLGRLICGRLSLLLGNARITLVLLMGQALTLFLAWRSMGMVSFLFIVLSGLGFSAIYPSLLALTSLLFRSVEGSALGILSTLAGLGSILILWLNGIVAERTSVGTGFAVLVAASIGALMLFGINFHRVRRRERMAADTATSA
ncbi:MAG: MFS transporter [Desulfosarcinaceae bacterium]|nr:MFS transporter [Desulfosarcinaceae bacterium]